MASVCRMPDKNRSQTQRGRRGRGYRQTVHIALDIGSKAERKKTRSESEERASSSLIRKNKTFTLVYESGSAGSSSTTSESSAPSVLNVR